MEMESGNNKCLLCNEEITSDIQVVSSKYPKSRICGDCIVKILGFEDEYRLKSFLSGSNLPTQREFFVEYIAEKVAHNESFGIVQRDSILMLVELMSEDYASSTNKWGEIHPKIVINEPLMERVGATSIENILRRLSADE